jgi:hypothetical protein
MMEKQKRLIDLLLNRSKKNELEWREAVQKNAFQVSFRDNTVLIKRKASQTGDPDESDYEYQLINDEGKTVDSFTDVELMSTEDERAEKLSWYRKSEELYDMARRTALGSEKVLNQILSDLSDDEDVP